MGRNHIHLAAGYKEDVLSGMRANCDLIIEIDLKTAMHDGIAFFLSENNVILTKGINGILPTKYFKRVTDNYD
jgi:2'-phosphotransferase